MNNKNVWYPGCMYDRYVRNKDKIKETTFHFSRILPYEMQEWLTDEYLELLPPGCEFTYTSKGYIFCVSIPRKYHTNEVLENFINDANLLAYKKTSEWYKSLCA
jgi:hypothetical protein